MVRGALASGSATHRLPAAGTTLVVTYWTTQNVGDWTSDKAVTVQMAAHLENSTASHTALVTRFGATFTNDAGTRTTTLRDDVGRFTITPPYSYGSAVVIPAQPQSARSAAVDVQFDLLLETAAASNQYFRQTVLDTLSFTDVPQESTR